MTRGDIKKQFLAVNLAQSVGAIATRTLAVIQKTVQVPDLIPTRSSALSSCYPLYIGYHRQNEGSVEEFS